MISYLKRLVNDGIVPGMMLVIVDNHCHGSGWLFGKGRAGILTFVEIHGRIYYRTDVVLIKRY